jgi:hypothetical protein
VIEESWDGECRGEEKKRRDDDEILTKSIGGEQTEKDLC